MAPTIATAAGVMTPEALQQLPLPTTETLGGAEAVERGRAAHAAGGGVVETWFSATTPPHSARSAHSAETLRGTPRPPAHEPPAHVAAKASRRLPAPAQPQALEEALEVVALGGCAGGGGRGPGGAKAPGGGGNAPAGGSVGGA